MHDILTLVINLDASEDRMASAAAALEEANWPYTRQSAFDARGMNPDTFDDYSGFLARTRFGRALRGSEIGCFQSHLKAAETFLASDSRYAVVLEDDMVLTPSFKAKLPKLIDLLDESAQPGWEVVNLGKTPRRPLTELGEVAGHRILAAHYFPVTTTGLLWTRGGAEAFLRSRRPIFAPVDHHLRRLFCARGTGIAADPPLVRPSGADSVINAGGKGRIGVAKKLYRLLIECKRQSRNIACAHWHAVKFRTRRLG